MSEHLNERQKQLPGYSIEKAALENFAKVTGKHMYRSLFYNKVAGLRSETLLKNRLRHRCFHVDFTKFIFVRASASGSLWKDLHLQIHNRKKKTKLKIYKYITSLPSFFVFLLNNSSIQRPLLRTL